MKRIRSRAGNLLISILAMTAIGCVVPQTQAGQETTRLYTIVSVEKPPSRPSSISS